MLISPLALVQDDPVDYRADDIYFRVDSTVGYLTGNAWVKSGSMTLTAHRIVLRLDDDEVCAFGTRDSLGAWVGRPVFEDNGQSFSQDQLCYNFSTGKGLSTHAVTQEQGTVFHAGKAKRQPDETVHVRSGKFTTCDAEDPHFHFHLSKAIMVPNDKVVSGPLYLKFRKIPTPLALPFGWFPLQQEKKSQGCSCRVRRRGQPGVLKDLGYYVPMVTLGRQAAGGHLHGRELGGSFGVQLQPQVPQQGGFNVSFQRQRQGFAGTPGFALPTTSSCVGPTTKTQGPTQQPVFCVGQFWLLGQFQQNLNSSQEEYLSNTFQSSVQWNLKVPRSPFSATVSARHSQNSNTGNVQLTVPSLSVNMQRTTLAKLVGLDAGGSLLDNVAVTYSSQMENSIEAPDSVFGALDVASMKIRNGLKHKVKVSSSSSLGFVSIAPSFSYNQYDSFEALDYREAVLGPDSVGLVSDTLGVFVGQRLAVWRVREHQVLRHLQRPSVRQAPRGAARLVAHGGLELQSERVRIGPSPRPRAKTSGGIPTRWVGFAHGCT